MPRLAGSFSLTAAVLVVREMVSPVGKTRETDVRLDYKWHDGWHAKAKRKIS